MTIFNSKLENMKKEEVIISNKIKRSAPDLKKDSNDMGTQKMLLFREAFALLTPCLSVRQKIHKHMKTIKWGYPQG